MRNLTVVKERKEQSSRRTMFLVPYTIEGKMPVWAEDEGAANLKFWQIDQRDLGEQGELKAFNPERQE